MTATAHCGEDGRCASASSTSGSPATPATTMSQFKEIGARLGPFDLGIIAVGGYEPCWFMGDMHVNPEESVQIHQDIRARHSIGVHWGTFPLTAEPIEEPPESSGRGGRGVVGYRVCDDRNWRDNHD